MLINSKDIIKNSKARGDSFLCLSSIALTVAVLLFQPVPVMAQSSPPVYATGAGSNAAQMEVRLQQMETQIRKLTGRVEEQVYEINSLKQKIEVLQNSTVASDAGAPQSLRPSSGQAGASHIAQPTQGNGSPLGLDFSGQKPKGMQTTTVIAGDSAATEQYEKSYADLKRKNYEAAQKGFDLFLSAHSEHILAANAKYWLGETYYVRGDYKKSARVFAEGFQTYPDSAKSPDILLKLGLSLKGLGKGKDACIALEQIVIKFPTGNESVLKRAEQERRSLSCGA